MIRTLFTPLQRIALTVLAFSVSAAAIGDDAPYAPMPWHLVDIWWDLGADARFESYSIDVEIRHDVPESISLYIAPIGIAHLNKVPFYGGLQTQSDGYTRDDRRLRKIGRGTLMSMWGERNHDAIRPSLGGFYQSSGHEGDFVSVRRPYAWAKGKYTYRVARMDEEVVDGKPCTWVGAFVYSHSKDENVFIGALRFPSSGLVLARRVASFVEIYGRAIPVEQIPRVDVVFNNLRVNGEPVAAPTAQAIYPNDVPDYANTSAAGDQAKDGVLIEVGKFVADRKHRRVTISSGE
jgi:hypothetical protein